MPVIHADGHKTCAVASRWQLPVPLHPRRRRVRFQQGGCCAPTRYSDLTEIPVIALEHRAGRRLAEQLGEDRAHLIRFTARKFGEFAEQAIQVAEEQLLLRVRLRPPIREHIIRTAGIGDMRLLAPCMRVADDAAQILCLCQHPSLVARYSRQLAVRPIRIWKYISAL